jgi:hypothetical protein
MFDRVRANLQKVGIWYRGFSWLKKRLLWVGIVLVPVWAATFYCFYFIVHNQLKAQNDLIVEITVAWSGELLFFTIVGLIVTFVTLQDPGEGALDDRIRILFGSEKIPDCVLNYNRNTLSRLSAYAEIADRTVIIEVYDDNRKAYKVKISTSYLYRNLLRDVIYDETLPLFVTPDEFKENAPFELGRVTSIKIDGAETITKQLPIEPKGFQTELRLKMDRGGQSKVVFEYWVWMAIGVPQTMHPKRIVELFNMKIINQCDFNPRLQIEGEKGGPKSLLYGQPVTFAPVQGISPGEKIFEFQLLSPA